MYIHTYIHYIPRNITQWNGSTALAVDSSGHEEYETHSVSLQSIEEWDWTLGQGHGVNLIQVGMSVPFASRR